MVNYYDVADVGNDNDDDGKDDGDEKLSYESLSVSLIQHEEQPESFHEHEL